MSRLACEQIGYAGRTDKGLVRQSNQDALGDCASRDGRSRAFVVCDGMGGHAGGETASRLAVEAFREVFAAARGATPERLRKAVAAANLTVYEAQLRDARLMGMGTTGVALGCGPDGMWVANVGDSRAYRLRGGRLEPLTQDHSVVGELQRRGYITAEEARTHPRRNEVLRSLGTEPDVAIDLDPVDVAPGDTFLLCSDGLCGVVPEEEIAELLADEDLEAAAAALIEAANQRGGPDNTTVQIVRVPTGAMKPERGPLSWLKGVRRR